MLQHREGVCVALHHTESCVTTTQVEEAPLKKKSILSSVKV